MIVGSLLKPVKPTTRRPNPRPRRKVVNHDGRTPFWWLLTMACVIWYSTITVYVAIRGAADIKEMLKRLRDSADEPPKPPLP